MIVKYNENAVSLLISVLIIFATMLLICILVLHSEGYVSWSWSGNIREWVGATSGWAAAIAATITILLLKAQIQVQRKQLSIERLAKDNNQLAKLQKFRRFLICLRAISPTSIQRRGLSAENEILAFFSYFEYVKRYMDGEIFHLADAAQKIDDYYIFFASLSRYDVDPRQSYLEAEKVNPIEARKSFYRIYSVLQMPPEVYNRLINRFQEQLDALDMQIDELSSSIGMRT